MLREYHLWEKSTALRAKPEIGVNSCHLIRLLQICVGLKEAGYQELKSACLDQAHVHLNAAFPASPHTV